jgi:hypothetical protein
VICVLRSATTEEQSRGQTPIWISMDCKWLGGASDATWRMGLSYFASSVRYQKAVRNPVMISFLVAKNEKRRLWCAPTQASDCTPLQMMSNRYLLLEIIFLLSLFLFCESAQQKHWILLYITYRLFRSETSYHLMDKIKHRIR